MSQTLPEHWDYLTLLRSRIRHREEGVLDALEVLLTYTNSREAEAIADCIRETWEYGVRMHSLGRPSRTDDGDITFDPMATP